MLRQIWQWLKRFFQKLLGLNSSSSSKYRDSDSSKPLSDTDYEFLFAQLLEGVKHGWNQKRVLKFFANLEGRTTQQEWIAWLHKFGDKVLASPASNQELGIRMIRFGQLTDFLPSIRRLGQESYQIGQQILNKHRKAQVWQYSEPEVPKKTPETTKQAPPPNSDTPMTADQLLGRLYEDPELAASLAKDLGLENATPEQMVNVLVNQTMELQREISSKKEHPEYALLYQGVEQLNQGNTETAIATWQKALEINPNLAPAWHNLGVAWATLGKPELAITNLQQAVKIEPHNHTAWNSLGNNLYKLQHWEEALAAWDQVITLKPEYYQAWYNRACALEHLERLPESLECYQKALEIKPDFSMAQSRITQIRELIKE